MIKLKLLLKENEACPRCKGWGYIYIRPGIPNVAVKCPLCNSETPDKAITIYRGEWTGNKNGNYYTTDKEWARQFTQSGLDKEIKTRKIKLSSIYKPLDLPLPKAYLEQEFDQAIEDAKEAGFDAAWFDEGEGNPPSIYVINKKSLLSEDLRSDEDDYYYHVTLAVYIPRIKREGLKINKSPTVSNYKEHSRGKIFLTNMGALDWWVYNIAAHAFHNFDDEKYHDIAVFKISKHKLKNVQIDNVGSDDSRGNSYYVTYNIPPDMLEFVKIEKSPY